jgi:hypothetical protein
MAVLSGADLLQLLRDAPPEELALPARDLLEMYDVPRCEDCGRPHDDVWEALACDDLTDARRRRDAARWHRTRKLAERALDEELAGVG